MPADRVHLVRHGEVDNPGGVLYGRLEGFPLSDLGRRMAKAAADSASADRWPIRHLVASPLLRTQQSAAPWSELFETRIHTDARVIEPWNVFEGGRVRAEIRKPRNWRHLVRPWEPSWGEPFDVIAERMLRAMDDAAAAARSGDAVIVSHQLPIWVAHLAISGQRLSHDPRKRRCALSSITSFVRRDEGWREVGYREPAADLLAQSVDLGAV